VSSPVSASPPPLSPVVRFLVLAVAAIGFLFDTYELLMLPLIGGPALSELLGVPPSNPLVGQWLGNILWAAAVCGGVSGLLGGWLIDRFGRKTIMVASILMYSLSPVAAAFSTNVWMFATFRCTTFIGVCVEFVAAVTWVAELFNDKRSRELALGWTLAFSSVGGLVVTFASSLVGKFAEQLPAIPVPEPFDSHAPWRYTLITGLVPGLLILALVPFVPESQVWAERRRAGTLGRPSFAALFAPQFRRVTLVATALSAAAYASAFGALQLTPTRIAPGSPLMHEQREILDPLQQEAAELNAQLSDAKGRLETAFTQVPGLKEKMAERDAVRRDVRKLRDKEFGLTLEAEALKAKGADAAAKEAKVKAVGDEIKTKTAPILPPSDDTKALNAMLKDNPEALKAKNEYEKALKDLGDNRNKQRRADREVREFGEQSQFWQETGGLVGRILLAVLLVVIASKGWLLRLFIIPGLIAFPLTYLFFFKQQPDWFVYGVFVCGLATVAQFSYFGEYLPKMYPLHLRGTGGSFATNVGGRMIGTSGSFVATNLLAPLMTGASIFERVAVAAGVVGVSVYLIGLVLSFFLPQKAAGQSED
jgi:MFS family permease